MPVNINEMSSEVSLVDQDQMSLSPLQIEELVQLIIARLEEKQAQDSLKKELVSIFEK